MSASIICNASICNASIGNVAFNALLTLFIALFTASCTGYKNDGKMVTFHCWNEASGSLVYEVPEANPKTFKALSSEFGHDDVHAFNRHKVIEGVDGKTFRVLKGNYVADATHVLYDLKPVDGADPATFKSRSNGLGEDKYDIYWRGKPIHVADRKTFMLLGRLLSEWGVDKHNAYFLGDRPVLGKGFISYMVQRTAA